MNPQNKQAPVALISGCSQRVGAAIARHLHEQQYRIVIHYHKAKKEAATLFNELNLQRTNSALCVQADLSCANNHEQLIKKTIDWAGQLNLLVNNASVFKRTDCKNYDAQDWQKLFALNVHAPFGLSLAAFRFLEKQHGAIINITDIHGEKPLKDYAIYCQSKAALALQTKALAQEFAPTVRVNSIAPGAVAWPEGENTLSPAAQQKIIQKTPLKRHGRPEFVAHAVYFLATNPFISGETIRIDGGRTSIG